MATRRSWASASDLADYAFCPRSHFYHEHPPAEGPSAVSRERALAGRRFHERTLTAERRRADHPGAYWAALAVGIVLLIGGAWWILHP